MKNFDDFELSKQTLKSLSNINFTKPTPIQEKSIPLALAGKDILGSAQTGTGKTAAFCIPMIEKLMQNDNSSALILSPTRELAKQILESVKLLLGYQNHLKAVALIGGESMGKQLSELRRKIRIIIGTPGRVNDHLERKTLQLKSVSYLVLDETDRMLDMGFGIQIDRIIKYIPSTRQTLMFSATLPKEIIKLSSKYLTSPERVSMGDTNVISKDIDQKTINLKSDDKKEELINQIDIRKGTILIFVKTKFGTEKLSKFLSQNKIKSFPLHGGLRQSKRNTVMKNFREEKFRILIATDVAARGLDVPHIQHVINYDLPQLPEDFIHRLGRTARAGLKGEAITFITSADKEKWRRIQNIFNPKDKIRSSKDEKNTRFKKEYSSKKFSSKKSRKRVFKDDEKSPKTFKSNKFETRVSKNKSFDKNAPKRRSFETSSEPRKRSFDKNAPKRRSFETSSEPRKRSFDKNAPKRRSFETSSEPRKRFFDKNAPKRRSFETSSEPRKRSFDKNAPKRRSFETSSEPRKRSFDKNAPKRRSFVTSGEPRKKDLSIKMLLKDVVLLLVASQEKDPLIKMLLKDVVLLLVENQEKKDLSIKMLLKDVVLLLVASQEKDPLIKMLLKDVVLLLVESQEKEDHLKFNKINKINKKIIMIDELF